MALGFLYGAGGGGQPKPEITELIPIMTSNNTPEGLCIGSTTYSSYALYKGFDGSLSTKTVFQDIATPYIGYRFELPVRVTAFSFRANTDAPYLPPTEMQFQASDDGTNWADVGEPITNIDTDADVHRFDVENLAPHTYYRWVCKARQYLANSYVQFSQLQLYGYKPYPDPPYTSEGLTVNADRCTIDSGGFRLLESIVEVDITFTTKTAINYRYGVVIGFPTSITSGDVTPNHNNFCINNTSSVMSLLLNVNTTIPAGTTIRFIGSYRWR